ncbi:MFS transporter [Antribacter sp. KLBMP9083]|uniref:MFS transporter n=1 Tax=Antribacter soli TaxID=2910976 RepID=A0AA41QB39_9MICO|nr:MFS transporter [Antribacter soli]MCF4119887.1 MFS transporter [Antribacter soli]
MRGELPPENLGSATAVMSASLGVGGAIGLPVAAFLAQTTDRHVLFWTSAVLGAVAFVLVLTKVPAEAAPAGGRFDLPGAIALSAALIALLLAISKGASHFGTKSELIKAVVSRHVAPMEQIHQRLLAEIGDDPGVRDRVACTVKPWLAPVTPVS